MSPYPRHFSARLACMLAFAGVIGAAPALAQTSRYLQRTLVADTAGTTTGTAPSLPAPHDHRHATPTQGQDDSPYLIISDAKRSGICDTRH